MISSLAKLAAIAVVFSSGLALAGQTQPNKATARSANIGHTAAKPKRELARSANIGHTAAKPKRLLARSANIGHN